MAHVSEDVEEIKRMNKYSQKEQNRSNNNLGHIFERLIDQACLYYRDSNVARIEKTPEPFSVVEKLGKGMFRGRFLGHAQPDYKGTLSGGRAIAFEAKVTTTNRLKKSVVTDFQSASLEHHYQLGADVGVCCMINKTAAFVPWTVWRGMKEKYGRQYLTEDDLQEFRVPTIGYIDFLKVSEVETNDWE